MAKKGEYSAQICPRVFKKPAKSKKSKMVDISICIDALRHSFHRDVQAILLLSGDGDYLPLIKEVMRNGTQVWLGAFSDGLSPTLPPAVDRFFLLDNLFFHSPKQQSRAVIRVDHLDHSGWTAGENKTRLMEGKGILGRKSLLLLTKAEWPDPIASDCSGKPRLVLVLFFVPFLHFLFNFCSVNLGWPDRT